MHRVKLLEPGPSVQSGLEDGQQPPSPSSSSVMETTGHFTKIKALGRESTVNTLMKQADLVGKGKREGREGKEGEGKQCIGISEGQEGPTQQDGVIWMEGACSLKLAEEEKKKLVARTSTIPPCLSDPHHLKHRAAVTMKSGSLLGKDVGNKIQESLSILLRMDGRDLCPRL